MLHQYQSSLEDNTRRFLDACLYHCSRTHSGFGQSVSQSSSLSLSVSACLIIFSVSHSGQLGLNYRSHTHAAESRVSRGPGIEGQFWVNQLHVYKLCRHIKLRNNLHTQTLSVCVSLTQSVAVYKSRQCTRVGSVRE